MEIKNKLSFKNFLGWNDDGKSFAFSPGGELIAVKTHVGLWDKVENVFVYDSHGKKIWSTRTESSGERGIAFWPDKNHVVVTGCEDDYASTGYYRDGIKLWGIGANDYNLVFDDTPMTGINVHLYGSSDNGKSLLARKSSTYCLQQGRQIEIKNISYSEVFFSRSGDYLVLVHLSKQEAHFLNLNQNTSSPLKLDNSFISFINDSQLVTANRNVVRVRELDSMNIVAETGFSEPLGGAIISGAYFSKYNVLAIAEWGGGITFWNYGSFTLLNRSKLPDGYNAAKMKFSDDGKLLIIGMGGFQGFTRNDVFVWEMGK